VRSRCQLIRLAVPEHSRASAWLRSQPEGAQAETLLKVAGGAPLAALKMARDGAGEAIGGLVEDLDAVAGGRLNPVQAANGWRSKGEARQLVAWVEMLAMDLARGRAGGSDALQIWDSVRIQRWLESLSSYRIQLFLEWLAETRRDQEQPLNDQLLAEALFVRWRQMTRPAG
jgi:DNA polymerase-3 subunit delta'